MEAADAELIAAGRDCEPRSYFQTLSFRHARDEPALVAAAARAIHRVLRRDRPTYAVLGSHPRESPASAAMRDCAIQVLEWKRIPYAVQSLPKMHALIAGPGRMEVRALATALIETVLPGLALPGGKASGGRAYVRSAWHALGLATLGLAEIAPLAAHALLRRDARAIPLRKQIVSLAQLRAESYATDPSPSLD